MTIPLGLAALAPSLLVAGVWLHRRGPSVEPSVEQALRESEERNRALLDAIPDIMFLQDKDGVYLDYHAPDPSALLLPPERFLGRPMREFLSPELTEEFANAFALALGTGTVAVVNYSLPIKGETRWFEARIVRSGTDKVLSVVRDFTDRKRAENALRTSEERYREVVELQTDLVCRYLPDTTLTFVNEAYCRFFGRSREDLIGRTFLDLIPQNRHEAVLENVGASNRDRPMFSQEHEVLLPDGGIGWQHWINHAVFAADGQVAEFQAIGRDITERKRVEEARQSLAHASRLAMLGELTAMIAHEVNQPLGAILSNADAADLLLESNDPPLAEIRRILADIRDDDMRASEAISRIRALVRKREMETEPLDLNEAVAHVVHLVSAEALRRQVSLETALAADLPAVRGDKVYLQQVLLNLLLNGMEAMVGSPAEEKKLTVRTAPGADGTVEVAVSDAGSGIPAERLPRLFDSFFTTKKDGMGLGLSIARSIVEAHGGRITAENNPGAGATFRVTMSAQPQLLQKDTGR